MPHPGFLRAGYKKNLFVADLLAECPEFVESFPFALITSLDSSPPTSLANVLCERLQSTWVSFGR